MTHSHLPKTLKLKHLPNPKIQPQLSLRSRPL